MGGMTSVEVGVTTGLAQSLSGGGMEFVGRG